MGSAPDPQPQPTSAFFSALSSTLLLGIGAVCLFLGRCTSGCTDAAVKQDQLGTATVFAPFFNAAAVASTVVGVAALAGGALTLVLALRFLTRGGAPRSSASVTDDEPPDVGGPPP
ncbi:MAG: hypothetical protein K1X89_13055 [Myxococcaceae bacterium]|nr:hypothetical protein [Myxococcaceae bacterium]